MDIERAETEKENRWRRSEPSEPEPLTLMERVERILTKLAGCRPAQLDVIDDCEKHR